MQIKALYALQGEVMSEVSADFDDGMLTAESGAPDPDVSDMEADVAFWLEQPSDEVIYMCAKHKTGKRQIVISIQLEDDVPRFYSWGLTCPALIEALGTKRVGFGDE